VKLDQKFQIRIDRHAARVLKETAERAGVSQSEYLRRLILARPALQPVQEKIKLQEDRIEKREDKLIAKEAELSRLKQMIIAWSLADDPDHPDVTALADEAYKMRHTR
jgi:hypothetical protein